VFALAILLAVTFCLVWKAFRALAAISMDMGSSLGLLVGSRVAGFEYLEELSGRSYNRS
jgi:hypothetical protein